MGRHKSDPHGAGRYVVVTGAVVVAVVLLVIGGLALFSVL
jgi:hypothetical protein